MIARLLVMGLLLALDGHVTNGQPHCRPQNPYIVIHEGQSAELIVECTESANATVRAFCSGTPPKPATFPTDFSPIFHTVQVSGGKGRTIMRTARVLDNDDECPEGSESIRCFIAPGSQGVIVSGIWSVKIQECSCGQKWQLTNGAICEDPEPTGPVQEQCHYICPDGQIYSTTKGRCFRPEECPVPCVPTMSTIQVYEGQTAKLCMTCSRAIPTTREITITCSGPSATPGVDAASSVTIPVTGRSGCGDLTTVAENNCPEGSETMTCKTPEDVEKAGKWDVTILECPCGKKWGTGETCEDRSTKSPGCYKACPAGRTYSTTQKRCYLPDDCPKAIGTSSGDPQYRTFDGMYYVDFHQCSHVSAEDCQNQTWSVYQFASNKCSLTRGGRATCVDQVMVKLKRIKTIVHYNRGTKSYRFIGNVPCTDDMIVSSNGYSFTAHLVQENVTVTFGGNYLLTITLDSKWLGTGKVCGLFGTPDGNRDNEWMLRDGTVLESYSDPRFEMEYRAGDIPGACQEPLPPEPVPQCSGSALKTALAFCRAMSDPAGSYTLCHATFPPGNTYKEPVDTPFEQCVLDHCLVDAETACSDILSYADQCRENGHRVGDPPRQCLPTCPNGFVYDSCGPRVPPTCDMPKGVDGCVSGCYCPNGTLLSGSNRCVSVCPAPVNFDRPTYYVHEDNGGVCIKLMRKGSLVTSYPIIMSFSRALSQDPSGPVGKCCGCTSVPTVCGGNTQCRLTFPANHSERCVWVKIDNDDSPSKDKKVTLSISGGQNNDKAKLIIKDDTDGNCLRFSKRTHKIQESTQMVKIGLELKNVSDVFWGEVTTKEGTASACSDYQSGKFEACFASSLTSSVTIPVARDSEQETYECFSQSVKPLGDGEAYEPPVRSCFPKYSLTLIADNYKNLPRVGEKYKCFDRTTSIEDICRHNTDVVRVTVLDEAQPEDCYLGYNIEVQHIYKGSLSQGEKTVLKVLPVERCPDPTFDYGADYLVAGDVVDGDLVVEGEGVVLDCPAYTNLNLPNLCP